MPRKKKQGEKIAPPKKEEEREYNPFSSIVLKEKKEPEKKKAPVVSKPKKPGEIVKGYVPSASFADILDSFEKTGNPYRLPQQKASKPSSSFGDILDQWEGKKSVKKNSKKETVPSPQYKATRSFGDILDQYEGVVRKEKASKAPKEEVKPAPKKEIKGSSMLLDETEEEKPSPDAVWSVIGGVNKNFVRKEEKKEEPKADKEPPKDKYNRVSPEYSPSKSFSEILSEYEGVKSSKKEEKLEVVEEPKKEEPEIIPEEHSFFMEKDEDIPISNSVVWSIMGGVNENFVREEKKEEEKEEVKEEVKEEKPIPRSSKPYVPTKSFSEILSAYSETKKDDKPEEPVTPQEPVFDEPLSDSFFIEENEENKVSSNVAWSIVGGANKDYVRKEEEKTEETQPSSVAPSYKRSQKYEGKKKFSSILSDYEKKETVMEKTFEEIMREKGDKGVKKARTFTLNELRRMDPQSTLDLHGEYKAEGEVEIRNFLQSSYDHGLRKISIITGKGLHSEDGQSVLRSLLEDIVKSVDYISEYNNAPLNKGGSGAMWIILKEKSDKTE